MIDTIMFVAESYRIRENLSFNLHLHNLRTGLYIMSFYQLL